MNVSVVGDGDDAQAKQTADNASARTIFTSGR